MPPNNPALPRETRGETIQLTVPTTALARTYDTTVSTATSITLNANTKLIEVTAINQGVFLKYAAGVSSSDFDEYIAADQTRHYVKPINVTVISVIEIAASASVIVIEK